LSIVKRDSHEDSRASRDAQATKRAPIVASARVFARATTRKSRAANDLRPRGENSPGQNAKILEPWQLLSPSSAGGCDNSRSPPSIVRARHHAPRDELPAASNQWIGTLRSGDWPLLGHQRCVEKGAATPRPKQRPLAPAGRQARDRGPTARPGRGSPA